MSSSIASYFLRGDTTTNGYFATSIAKLLIYSVVLYANAIEIREVFFVGVARMMK